MFQAKFFQLLFFGLVSSLSIYNHHFVEQASSSSRPRINAGSALATPEAGKSHVLVTHGAGFFGAHLATALLEAGHAVTLVDADAALYRLVGRLLTAGPRLKLAAADLSDAAQLAAVLKRAQPAVDVVLQLQPANAEELAAADPLAWLSTSSMQLLSLLKAMNESHSSMNKLVLASSYAVYDQPSAAQLPAPREPPACQPATAHGQAALFGEAAVRSFAAARPQFGAAILRHSSVIGANRGQLVRLLAQDSSSSGSSGGGQLGAISACLAAASQDRQQPGDLPVPPASGSSSAAASRGGGAVAGGSPDPSCFCEFLHVADLASGFVAAIQEDSFGNPPRVYNLGPGRALSHGQVLEACERLSGVAPQATQQIDGADGSQQQQACHARNISKLQADTGWRPQQLGEALADALVEDALVAVQQQLL